MSSIMCKKNYVLEDMHGNIQDLNLKIKFNKLKKILKNKEFISEYIIDIIDAIDNKSKSDFSQMIIPNIEFFTDELNKHLTMVPIFNEYHTSEDHSRKMVMIYEWDNKLISFAFDNSGDSEKEAGFIEKDNGDKFYNGDKWFFGGNVYAPGKFEYRKLWITDESFDIKETEKIYRKFLGMRDKITYKEFKKIPYEFLLIGFFMSDYDLYDYGVWDRYVENIKDFDFMKDLIINLDDDQIYVKGYTKKYGKYKIPNSYYGMF